MGKFDISVMAEIGTNSKLFRFLKTVHPIKSYVARVSTSFMLSEGLFEKPTTPSFRAYFITLICVLVSWNYRPINDNWNVGKIIHSFSPSKGGSLASLLMSDIVSYTWRVVVITLWIDSLYCGKSVIEFSYSIQKPQSLLFIIMYIAIILCLSERSH